MSKTIDHSHNKQRAVSLDMDEVHKLYELSTRIADATEDVLEQEGAYSASFLSDLDRAKRDVVEGKTERVTSLHDLM